MVYVQWQASVSVYMQSLGFPLRTYSLLWTLNGALVFALQPVVSWGTRRIPRLHVHMLVGTVFIALAYALLAVFRQYWAFAAGMVLLTCGEVWVWPAVPAAIARLTPPERQGLLQGLTGGGATLGRMIGPVLGGILYDRGDIHALWLICALFMLCPFVLFLWYGYWGGEWNRVRAEG
jgi:predicted MFS family arabinose efflux permease